MIEFVAKKSRAEAEKASAQIIAQEIVRISAVQDKVILGLCGGTSVAGIYRLLASMEVQWSKVHFFMADERLVPVDSPDSNYKLAYDLLLQPLLDGGKIMKSQLHAPIYRERHPDFGLIHYVEEIKKVGARFDIVLLSSGEDGHIAALYPCHHSISSSAKLFLAMDDSPKLPKLRMTATKALLLTAKVGVLLFFGEGKRKALEIFKDEIASIEDCPAKLVKGLPKAFVVTDLPI